MPASQSGGVNMGFLDSLLRRVVSSAVDTAVDSIMDTVSGKNGQSERHEASAAGRSDTAAENKKATRQENNSGERLLRQRIEEIAAREFPQYELRQRIPGSQAGVPGDAESYFDYGFYQSGILTAVINILDDNNAYRCASVRLAQKSCHDRQIVYMNFMSYMMNRPEYIAQRLKANLR